MKLRTSKALKTAACILFFVMTVLSVLSGVCAIVMANSNVYYDSGISVRENIARIIFHERAHICFDYASLINEGDISNSTKASYEKQLSRGMCNLAIRITLYDDYDNSEITLYENYPTTSDYQYKFSSARDYSLSRNNHKQIIVTAYLQKDLSGDDAYRHIMPLVDFAIEARYTIIWVSAISAVFALALLIFLMYAAGHVKGCGHINLSMFDRIPADVLLLVYFLLFMFTVAAGDEFMHNDVSAIIFLCTMIIVWVVFALMILMTLAVRVKSRTLLKNTFVWRALKLLWRGIILIFGILAKFPFYAKTALVFILWTLIELLFFAFGFEDYILLWIFTRPFIAAALVYLVLMLRRLQKAGNELASGNISARVDTKYMLPDLKEHGNALNNLSVGLNRAVEERMKSERMKSELITNVSHDIKTPLTSIINYVDLLKTNGLDSPDAPSYLEVLDKQSARLKKLTEDLIEASKAASGTLSYIPAPTDIGILLSQALGEYEERLRDAGIEPIFTTSESPLTVMADGRLLWRVFDNLFSNIRKYAMPSTRAYFTCESVNGNAVITFRNISDKPVSIGADELCERFVRGDESRHTDGSGLGLSIARSLTELQGGVFGITVDGDLFKVAITFALCSENTFTPASNFIQSPADSI